MNDNQLNELKERNAKRLQAAKEALGPKYLLHKDNQVKRIKKKAKKKIQQGAVL
jgi:ribosomal protein L13E